MSAPNTLNWQNAIARCESEHIPWCLATVISTSGSSPRKSGSKMVITAEHCFDTIGGGELEFKTIARARELLLENSDQQRLEHFPLAAKASQCCGGNMTVLLEAFAKVKPQVHIFGAGHVAKALVNILGEMAINVHWVDNREHEFPAHRPNNTKTYCYDEPTKHINKLTAGAYCFVLTHNHALDYELIEYLLDRKDCAFIGLIGSQTKASRFRKRLHSHSFSTEEIDQVICPVGLPEVPGHQPIEIAVSIAGQLIQRLHLTADETSQPRKKVSGLPWRELKPLIQAESETEK